MLVLIVVFFVLMALASSSPKNPARLVSLTILLFITCIIGPKLPSSNRVLRLLVGRRLSYLLLVRGGRVMLLPEHGRRMLL